MERELSKKPETSRKQRRRDYEHPTARHRRLVKSWSLLLSALASVLAIILLAGPPEDRADDLTSQAAAYPNIGIGGPNHGAVSQNPAALPVSAPVQTATSVPKSVPATGSTSSTASPSGDPANPSAPSETGESEPSKSGIHPVRYTVHEVKRGEKPAFIADQYDINLLTIRSVNGLDSKPLKPGQKLRVPDQDGLIHKVQKDDTLEDIALLYNVRSVESIAAANALLDADDLSVGKELFVPGAKIPQYWKDEELQTRRRNAQREALRRGSTTARSRRNDTTFALPTAGSLRSGFGYRTHPISHRWTMHKGVDIGGATGSPIYAAMTGVVRFAGSLGGYGRLVVLDHGGGYQTRYAHCSKLNVKEGQRVGKGDRIASVGATGYTTGPHLHFEVWRNGKAVNPMSVLRR